MQALSDSVNSVGFAWLRASSRFFVATITLDPKCPVYRWQVRQTTILIPSLDRGIMQDRFHTKGIQHIRHELPTFPRRVM